MTDFVIPKTDLLVAAESHAWVEDIFAEMLSPEARAKISSALDDTDEDDDFFLLDSSLRPYRVKEGVLTIAVKGMLMANLPFQLGSMATGYDYITQTVMRGVADPDVNEIVMDINSPGGTVPGCFDCADAIYAARGVKPIRAVANEFAYSAAYAIASSADTIAVARTGGVGSIGVMTAHMDMTGRLAAQGVKVTPVFAGKNKVDGQPYVPLTDAAKARMQERVDAIHDIFVATVARNRGMDEQAVRDTEAATFMAQQAVDGGLADTVGSLGTLSAYADPSQQDEDDEMSTNDNSAVDQAALDTAVAAAAAEATEAGKAEGANAERARVSAILDSEEAKVHPEAARHVALNTDMTAEAAKALLAAMPAPTKAAAPAGKPAAAAPADATAFAAAMMSTGNPELGAAPTDDANDDETNVVEGIFASAGFKAAKA